MALLGLKHLKEELAENSGVDTSLTGMFDSLFGKWKALILATLTSLITVVGLFTLCGCCIVPCVRSLVMKSIESSVVGTMIKYSVIPVTSDENDDFSDELSEVM